MSIYTVYLTYEKSGSEVVESFDVNTNTAASGLAYINSVAESYGSYYGAEISGIKVNGTLYPALVEAYKDPAFDNEALTDMLADPEGAQAVYDAFKASQEPVQEQNVPVEGNDTAPTQETPVDANTGQSTPTGQTDNTSSPTGQTDTTPVEQQDTSSTDTSSPPFSPSESSTGDPINQTPTQPSSGTGSSVSGIGTEVTIGLKLNQMKMDLVSGTGTSADKVNSIINYLNAEKAATYAQGASYELKDASLLDIYNAAPNTYFELQDGTEASREDLLQGTSFKYVDTDGFYQTTNFSQSLINYEAALKLGYDVGDFSVEPAPQQKLSPVELPDYGSMLNNQTGSLVKGEGNQIEDIQKMPDQSKTDITGNSGQ